MRKLRPEPAPGSSARPGETIHKTAACRAIITPGGAWPQPTEATPRKNRRQFWMVALISAQAQSGSSSDKLT
jgi:hypothetical protein